MSEAHGATRLGAAASDLAGRIPIRWRLTLAFVGAIAVVLCAAGVFLHADLRIQLDKSIERSLRVRFDQLGSLLLRSPISSLPSPPSATLEAEESIAQILDSDGQLLAASSVAGVPLLTAEQLRTAAQREILVDRPGDAAFDESIRILAGPVGARGQTFVVLVSDSVDERDEALAALGRLEVVGFGAALVASGAVGFWVAGIALRPVEALRRRASEITGAELAAAPPAVLPVSAADDEVGRLGHTLNQMLDRIRSEQQAQRDLLDRQRRFLADASHQLRTPLAIIKAEAELALASWPGPAAEGTATSGPPSTGTATGAAARSSADALRAALASADEEADRLVQLTDQLLLLAAADEQRLSVTTTELRLADLLTATASRSAPLADQAGRTLRVAADPVLVVHGDRVRLEHAVGNLVDNALAHGAGPIELTAERAGDELRISVRDRGAGFPESYLERPFERFARAGGSAGSGLGLAIVQAIAEAHQGRVELSNDAGASAVLVLRAG